MNAKFSAALLAATMGAAGLFLPAVAQAALVGHKTTNCGWGGDTAAMIVAAGHTPVAVATIDANSLSGLAAFVYEKCSFGSYVSGEVVDAAVANGMVLVTHPWPWNSTVTLPGSVRPGMVGDQTPMVLPVGSPALTGPGGALSSTRSYESYPQGFFQRSTLPQGSMIVATSDRNTDRVVAFAYDYGRGRVVASTVALNYFLAYANSWEEAANVRNYAINLIAWAVGPGFSSCAAEGYAGAKLTLCRQVCEIDQTPSRLLSLIKLYKAIYRVDPPCAR